MKNEIAILSAEDMQNSITSARNYKVAFATLLFITSILVTVIVNYLATITKANEDYKNAISSLKFDITSKDYQIKNMNEEIAELENALNDAYIKNNDFESTISSMSDIINEIQEDNNDLIEENKSLKKEIKEYTKRNELFNKYEYAVLDKSGNRTDLTYDQIETAETLMEKKGLDPDILLGVIMVESGGVEKCINSESTARGYGQILEGTGQFVYENLEGNPKGSYDHSMALDGYNNIRMTSELWGWFNESGKSLYQAIQKYRGKEDVSGYIAGINSYLSTKGKTIYSCKW